MTICTTLAAGLAFAGCGKSSSSNPPTPTGSEHSVVANVTGLTGTGLHLSNSISGGAGEDLTFDAAGSQTFATKVQEGATYAVTVTASPATESCTIQGSSTGAMGTTDVTVNVSCSPTSGTPVHLQVAVTGLASPTTTGLVLQNNLGNDFTVTANGTYPIGSGTARTGDAYSVTVKTQPVPFRSCNVTNASGTVAASDVTVTVSCSSVVVQRWEATTSWGAVWKNDGHMVQHATFDSTGAIHEESGLTWGLQNGPLPAPRRFDFPAGPRYGVGPFGGSGNTAQRYQATNDAALAQDGDLLVCAIVKPDYGTPPAEDWGKPIIAKGLFTNGDNSGNSGWALQQRHGMFSFFYKPTGLTDTGSPLQPVYTPNYFTSGATASSGPLNPSFVVICGGRDGNTIHVKANSISDSGPNDHRQLVSGTLALDAGNHPTTIGGWDNGGNYEFGGRIYETAVWHEPANATNIQAKFAAVQGLAANPSEPGIVTIYTRNREGPMGTDAASYHTTWRHGPRIDPTQGFLFGLQGWNRLSSFDAGNNLVTPGEDLGLWTNNGGSVDESASALIPPPGDSEKFSVGRVSLPNGTSLSTTLGAFLDLNGNPNPGPVHGQIWLRGVGATASGTVLVRLRNSADPPTAGTTQSINLPANAWTRFPLTALTTNGVAGGTLSLEAPSGAIQFYAWGVDLTQLSLGDNLGPSFDPGLVMYDWSASIGFPGDDPIDQPQYPVDMLELPVPPDGTASAGFCLSADAKPPAGVPWISPFISGQFIATWLNDSTPSPALADGVALMSRGTTNPDGPALCFCAGTLDGVADCACASPSWANGSEHTLTGCITAGTVQLYADSGATPIATANTAFPVPNVTGGHLVVGNVVSQTDPGLGIGPHPWNGYISKVLVCRGQADCQ